MRNFFRNRSIRTKLALITVTTSVIALSLACLALFAYEVKSFKETVLADLKSHAAILAGLSTAALTFDDSATAAEILDDLKDVQHVRWAVLFKEGEVFATYAKPDAASNAPTQPPLEFGEVFTSDGLLLYREIRVRNERAGTIFLCADNTLLRVRLREYGKILVAVLLAASVVALLLASILQRSIIAPVEKLAEAARIIGQEQNYSVRVERRGGDELGRLTDAFNQMLNRIEAQDVALREERERFEAAVAGARDGIWDWNLLSDEMYLSPRSRAMLGRENEAERCTSEAWHGLIHPDERMAVSKALIEYLDGKRPTYEVEARMRQEDGSYRWILTRGAASRDASGKPCRMAGSLTDISERKQTEEELARVQRELVLSSRQAGMAEVATGVLHNVGNVLNSVNVSVSVLQNQLRKSKIPSLGKTAALLKEHAGGLAAFLTEDPKGQQLPGYIEALSDRFKKEHEDLTNELRNLQCNLEHIEQVIVRQQTYAKLSGTKEKASAEELVEDAMRLCALGLAKHNVEVVREYDRVPPVLVDRHKVLQILINLITNAKQAMDHRGEGRRLILRIRAARQARVLVEVVDNGMGIAADHLTRIFQHGFTTKKTGHGFGLHSCANASKEMGGSLNVFSAGPEKGAAFVLELPGEEPVP